MAAASELDEFISAASSTILKYSSWYCAHNQAVTVGCPSVSVPVLSKTTTSALFSRSKARESFIQICISAALPIPRISATGVIKPNAHGQATMKMEITE